MPTSNMLINGSAGIYFRQKWFDKCEIFAGFSDDSSCKIVRNSLMYYSRFTGYFSYDCKLDFNYSFAIHKFAANDFVSYDIEPKFMVDQAEITYTVRFLNYSIHEIEILNDAFNLDACTRRGTVFQIRMDLSHDNINVIIGVHNKIVDLIHSKMDYIEFYCPESGYLDNDNPLSDADLQKTMFRPKYIVGRKSHYSYSSNFGIDRDQANKIVANLADVDFQYFMINSAYLNFGNDVVKSSDDNLLLVMQRKGVHRLTLSLSDENKGKDINKKIIKEFRQSYK